MSNVHFTADLHFGHKNIANFRPQFDSEEHHRECIKDNWCSVIKSKRDTVWVLGDSVFDEAFIEDIKSLPGTKKLIMGNHCMEKYPSSVRLWECFDDVRALVKKYKCWLSHAPIHPAELRGKVNIHGHVHNATLPDARYINISLENTNFTPVDLNWIRDKVALSIK